MSSNPDDRTSTGLSLIDVDSKRNPEERSRDGKSGEILYRIEYNRGDDNKTVEGKVIEIGKINESKHEDLQTLDDTYTHYGIFRLRDRSTTTLVQDEQQDIFKVFSFSKQNVEVSHPTTITPVSESDG